MCYVFCNKYLKKQYPQKKDTNFQLLLTSTVGKMLNFAYLVQEVSGFHQFWPERIELYIRGIQIPIISLWQAAISLPNCVKQSVMTNGFFHITIQHLIKTRYD